LKSFSHWEVSIQICKGEFRSPGWGPHTSLKVGGLCLASVGTQLSERSRWQLFIADGAYAIGSYLLGNSDSAMGRFLYHERESDLQKINAFFVDF
jgi:hypothetical protein